MFSRRAWTRSHGPVWPSASDWDSSEGEEGELDELDHRDEGQFWSTRDQPDESEDGPACEPYDSDKERPTPAPAISLFAIGKLSR